MGLPFYRCPCVDLISLFIKNFQRRSVKLHTGRDVGFSKTNFCRLILNLP